MGALALPIIGGLALGGLGLGAAAIARNQQNSAANQAAQQQNMASQMALQQSSQQQALLMQQQSQNNVLSQQRSQALSGTIGDPIRNPGGLAPNPMNSPLFDTSTLKTGRNTLLGN